MRLCGLGGDEAFIERAREIRHAFGGFMKQSAAMAAAGLVALRTMIPRLVEDHENAALLAEGLRGIPGIDERMDVEDAHTNMVFVRLKRADADAFVEQLAGRGVLTYHFGGGRLRFVTHRDVTADDVRRAVQTVAETLR